jgi:uncharacterized protein YndB with AHSA1/START domain
MAARTSAATERAERVLVITRVFDAPRELVFRAWTEREHLIHWMSPRGFTIPAADGDLRPGGAWTTTMHPPQGPDLRLQGVYREIVRPERLVFTHAWLDDQGKPGHETLVTVTFSERGGKTEVTLHQAEFTSLAERDGHRGGWTECFERLAEHLAA